MIDVYGGNGNEVSSPFGLIILHRLRPTSPPIQWQYLSKLHETTVQGDPSGWLKPSND